MQAPKNWKAMERHPLSAEYPDITGKAWERFVANLRDLGVVGRRPVIVHEGKVIDGWQLYRGCVAADVRPDFAPLPEGINPAAYVETVNDHRRHETQEAAMRRVEKRRGRVVEARREGKSLRAIAEAEGVDVATVHKDIKASTVDGSTVDPPSGKVTGKDGRTRPAKAPKPAPAERLAAAADDAEPETESTPDETMRAKNTELESWCRGLTQYGETMPDDPWLQDMNRRDGAAQKLKAVAETIRSAKCVALCPKCDAQGCRHCRQTGRLTKYAKDQLG